MQIEIFSDLVCPWCYIGKKRLDSLMHTPVGEGLRLRWRPYQLHPGLPDEGLDRQRFLQARYGAKADLGRIPPRIAEQAETVGLRFNFAAIKRQPNTFQAHRLLEFAAVAGRQHEVAEALFERHFCAGEDVGQTSTLIEAAEQASLSGADAEAWLSGQGGVEEVREQLQRAVDLGVAGVPSYLLAGKFTLPGAQTAEVMGQFIQRAKERAGFVDGG